jgi:hypothetical protein
VLKRRRSLCYVVAFSLRTTAKVTENAGHSAPVGDDFEHRCERDDEIVTRYSRRECHSRQTMTAYECVVFYLCANRRRFLLFSFLIYVNTLNYANPLPSQTHYAAENPKNTKRWIWAGIRRHYGALPVAEAFEQIYRSKAWGEADGEAYCSGFGSASEFAAPYAEWVNRFVNERGIRTIVDLGCGDIRVGRLICANSRTLQYVGLDVVPDLVAYNNPVLAAKALNSVVWTLFATSCRMAIYV